MAQCSVRSTTRGWSQRLLSSQPKSIQRTSTQVSAFSSSSRHLASEGQASATPAKSLPSEPLTLWHKTSKILPVALDSQLSGSKLPALDTWERVLSNAYDDMSNVSPRPIRILGEE